LEEESGSYLARQDNDGSLADIREKTHPLFPQKQPYRSPPYD
jgi:hypothetical protein